MLKKRSLLLSVCLFALILCGILIVSSQKSHAQSIYDNINVQPLDTAECARCHTSHFNRLRNNGARHEGVACSECHEQYHVYNPLKKNYAEIMPKCSQCHDAPHGTDPKVNQCADCHMDPHQPLTTIPDPSGLESLCRSCHNNIAAMLKRSPSKHTNEDCSSCHSEKHGRIPVCVECHENHSPMVAMKTPACMACHPVHTPLEIVYPVSQNKELCAGCHEVAYDLLRVNVTKHTPLTCAKCHPSHGEIPRCQRCHSEAPHDPAIHKKFPACGSCHTIAHDLRI